MRSRRQSSGWDADVRVVTVERRAVYGPRVMQVSACRGSGEVGVRTLANSLVRWISCCCRRVHGQRGAFRGGVAGAGCFDSVSIGVGQLRVADTQRTGAAAAGDRDAATEVAIVQNRRALLPDETDCAWTTGRGRECCRSALTDNLVTRVRRVVCANGDIRGNGLVISSNVCTA